MSPRPKRLPKTAIHDLAGLFKSPPGEPRKHEVGFPEGSTVLVTGRPGSGKSFFALSLAREHLRAYQHERKAAGGSGAARLIFVGVGADRKRLKEQYGAFGWFGSDPDDRDPIDCEVVSVDETTLPQPAAGAEELITPLLTRLRRATIAAKAGGGDPAVFVVFDSLTSMVKGSATGGERQRYIQELIRLTKDYLRENKKLCVLTADAADAPDDGIRPERETAADFVFHVGFRDTGAGRTARVLDVRKCPEHTPMLVGRHSWEVLHPGNIEDAIAPRVLQDRVLEGLSPGTWGVVYVSPHLDLPAVGALQDASPLFRKRDRQRLVDVRPDRAISCGIPGLDEMLAGDQDYWSKQTRVMLDDPSPPTGRGLSPGSVTFLIGRAGTGKSNSCLQFLLAAADAPGSTEEAITRCLYVNFENLFSQVLDWYPGHDDQRERLRRRCKRLYRRRTQFDYAHFVHELYFLIQEHEIERVAFDGLTDLARADNPQEFEFLLEELVVLVRKAKIDDLDRLRAERAGLQKRIKAAGGSPEQAALQKQFDAVEGKLNRSRQVTIFVSLEADPDSPDAARYEQKNSPADNVVVFRQVKINDERRKTVEVRKARGRAPDRQVRELVVRPKSSHPLRVVSGLDNYRHVTDGQPEPVRVALQLVGENRAAGRANLRLADRLDGLFGYPLTTYEFARGEIARTLRDIAGGADRIPTWDVKLFHVDEWWVRELRVNTLRRPDRLLAQSRHALMRLNAFLATDPAGVSDAEPTHDVLPTEFWAVEMEKGCVPVVTGGDDGRSSFRADVIALPAYADFGLFCFNLQPGAKPAAKPDDPPFKPWREVLEAVPRVWAAEEEVGGRRWFAEPKNGTDTVVDYMIKCGVEPVGRKKPGRGPEAGAPIGFAFDMATPATAGCGFLELCWAFGASEDFLVRDVTEPPTGDALAAHPAVRALTLLMFLVAEGLMPRRTTLADTRRAVFSRHWYSSLPFIDDAVAPRDLPDEAPAAPPGLSPDVGARRPGWVKRPPVEPEDPTTRAERVRDITIYPVPFFPLGVGSKPAPNEVDVRTRICLHDAIVRFGRLLKRVEAAVEYRARMCAVPPLDPAGVAAGAIARARQLFADVFPLPPDEDPAPGSFDWWDGYHPWTDRLPDVRPGAPGHPVRRIVAAMRDAGGIVQKAVLESPLFGCGRGYEYRGGTVPPPGFNPDYPGSAEAPTPQHWPHLPYAMFLDVRDVLELLRWHDHRLRALDPGRAGTNLAGVVLDPPAEPPKVLPKSAPGTAALSGFGCQGSWLVGADRTTRSPNLSAKFLTEMTSLESCQERAWLGAGIPPRKDFYEFYGDTPVPCASDPALTWNKLFESLGARARRRSRTFCARTRVTLAFAEIDRLVLDCLTRADVRRGDYQAGGRREEIVRELTDAAADAVRRLFEWVRGEMRAQYEHDREAYRRAAGPDQDPRLPRRECVTCPNRAGCAAVLADRGAP